MGKVDDKVSVVIPVHNSEKFLSESIESVLNQTYKNIEIIAVNDGSTDNSSHILENYSDEITVLTQKNQGLASALNLGISKMSGKWFRWFSPDDIMDEKSTEILLDNYHHNDPNCIVYSNWNLIDENGKIMRPFLEQDYNSLNNFDFNVRLLSGQQINVNTAIIPYSLIKQGCVMRELKNPVVIDYDFFLRAGILFDTRFHLNKNHLVNYRVHNSQLSHRNIVSTLDYIEELINGILSNLTSLEEEKYRLAINKFNKQKKISTKTMELGLKILKKSLPNYIADSFLVFYLNKIRHHR